MRRENPSPQFIYKVAPRALWMAAETAGGFAGAPVDLADGFIHFSTAEQLAETLAKHFAGQGDLVLAAIRTERLGLALKWEVSRGGALFPHLYGALDMTAVEWTAPLAVAADGSCNLPEAVR
jgi:uncharacterized protein (DUF952 family)